MGLTARQQRVFDRDKSIQESHKDAVAEHEKNVRSNARGKASKGRSLRKLVKRRLRELFYGGRTYLPKGGRKK